MHRHAQAPAISEKRSAWETLSEIILFMFLFSPNWSTWSDQPLKMLEVHRARVRTPEAGLRLVNGGGNTKIPDEDSVMIFMKWTSQRVGKFHHVSPFSRPPGNYENWDLIDIPKIISPLFLVNLRWRNTLAARMIPSYWPDYVIEMFQSSRPSPRVVGMGQLLELHNGILWREFGWRKARKIQWTNYLSGK